MKASVRHVLLAVEVGEASLVGESAGYIVLGAADRALVRASVAHTSSVFLDVEGQVHLDGTDADAAAVEASLRLLLGELLGHVRTPCPNLERVAQRRECRGLSTLVTELEAALVPVNRRAARRSLGRLCRDAERSRHLEWTRARVEPVVARAAGLPTFEPAHLGTDAHDDGFEVHFEEGAEASGEVAGAAPNTPASDALQAFEAPPAFGLPPAFDSEDSAVTTLRDSAGVEIYTSVHAPVHHVAPRSGEALLLAEASMVGAVAEYEGDAEAALDQEPTRLRAIEVEADRADDEPTRLLAPAVREATELREASEPSASARPVRKVRVLGAWRSAGPDLPDDAPIVDVPDSAQPRRPSDVSELLARFQKSEPVRVELLEGLRALARVERTPAPPPLGGPTEGEQPASRAPQTLAS